jgi:hypothetical protein
MNSKNKTGLLHLTVLGFAASFLQSQSRETLRTLAANAGVPTGRNKKDTLRNLNDALADKKVHLSTYLTFRTARNQNPKTGQYDASMGQNQRDLLSAKVRTHRPAELTFVAPRPQY